jgi:hypothetical protein
MGEGVPLVLVKIVYIGLLVVFIAVELKFGGLS